MTSLAYANLPGIGQVLDPEPRHYRKAAHFLLEDYRKNRPSLGSPKGPTDPRIVMRIRLFDTARRIEWRRQHTADAFLNKSEVA